LRLEALNLVETLVVFCVLRDVRLTRSLRRIQVDDPGCKFIVFVI
jgi:hypothetical protein